MGEQDIAEKTLLSYNDVFADILNVLLFKGSQVVQTDELIDANTFSQYKAVDGDIKEQERDVSKYWNNGEICLSLFGLENQTRKDTMMPLRVMGYDGASYRAQTKKKAEELYPVITLVLYFGTEHKWEKPKSLKDSLHIDTRIEPFVSDYKLNVFNLAWLTDEEINAFKSDFKIVAEYLRAVRVGEVQEWEAQKIKYVEEICDLLKAVSHDDIFDSMKDFIIETQREKGGFQMSEFVQKMITRGRNEGIALGRNEGIVLGRNEGITLGEQRGIAFATNRMTSIMTSLYAQGRDADVKRAMTDSAYLQQLIAEYAQ